MELVGKGFGKKAKVESPRRGNQLNMRVEEGQKSRQDPVSFPGDCINGDTVKRT